MNNGTQFITRQNVIPGMLVMHEGKAWKASANTRGNLYIYRLYEAKRISDPEVEICLDAKGRPQIS